ncbi:MAG: hypothetical protein HYY16_13945 [Planctomycetes bacterium]|nr:hypothetical protein [Planctomycetota bacterium]
MRTWTALTILLASEAAFAQSDDLARQMARDKAAQAKADCAEALSSISGVAVHYGGSGITYHLVVIAPDVLSLKDARTVLRGGDWYEGVQILWMIQPPRTAAATRVVDLPAVATPRDGNATLVASGHRENFWQAAVTDCDIIAQHLGVKSTAKVKRDSWGGRPLPCRLIRRSVVPTMGYGGWSYNYTKHRNDCPVRLGQVSQPEWADHFIAWVFQEGFTPVARAGFTWPYELRGDDRMWSLQAKGDLMTRLPHIREGAEWVNTPTDSRAGKLGSRSPGSGWTWGQSSNVPQASPTPTPGSGGRRGEK